MPTYQDFFSLQNVLLWQLSGRASCIHCVAHQIRIHWHHTSTEIVAVILTDLEISTWSHSAQLVVTLLCTDLRRREKSEANGRKFTFDVITFCSMESLHWNVSRPTQTQNFPWHMFASETMSLCMHWLVESCILSNTYTHFIKSGSLITMRKTRQI